MEWPTPEQVERYIKFADAELGPESSDKWVETIRHILRDLACGKANLSYGVLYKWGGGGSSCAGGCRWRVIEGACDFLMERCANCGAQRSRSFGAGC